VPQIATGLDAEFVAVQESLNDTINRLGELQRDDGALRDAIVSAQSLSPTVLALIGLNGVVPRGAWTAAVVYAQGDVVGNGGGTYLAVSAHTANADFAVDQVAGKWLTLEAPFNNSITVQRYTANGSQVAFSLGGSGVINTTNTFINGVYQNKDTYSINGSTLTFEEAPPSGAIVEIIIGAIAPVTAVVPDLSISTAKIADGAVTPAKLSTGGPTWGAGGELTASQLYVTSATGDSKIEVGGPGNVYIDLKNPYSDDYDLRIAADAGGNGGSIYTSNLPLSVSGAPLLLNAGGGNVGIGTSSPTAKLEVAGGNIVSKAGTQYGGIAVRDNNNNTTGYIIGTSATNDSGQIGLLSGAVQKVTINSSGDTYFNGGNVGIGTTNPVGKLTIKGGTTTDTTPELKIEGVSGSFDFHNSAQGGNYNPIVQAGDKTIIFSNGSTESGNLTIAPWSTSEKGIRLTSDGNVGIGTSAPTAKLEVAGDIKASGAVRSTTTCKSFVNFNGSIISGFTAPSSTLVVTSGSNVGTWNYTGAFAASTVGCIYFLNIGGTNATLGGVDVSAIGIRVTNFVSANQVTFTLLAGNATSSQTVTGTGAAGGYSFSTSGIRSSYNVSSITKNGTGTYTVNFATALADASYTVSGCPDALTGNSVVFRTDDYAAARSTTSVRVQTLSPTGFAQVDSAIVQLQIFGN
jgi:hypothetical protein